MKQQESLHLLLITAAGGSYTPSRRQEDGAGRSIPDGHSLITTEGSIHRGPSSPHEQKHTTNTTGVLPVTTPTCDVMR